jgi:hypothetical protein
VLEFALLKTEEVRLEPMSLESRGLLDALELAPSAINQLAIGWTFARGEFDGLRVERPVRMAHQGASVWL